MSEPLPHPGDDQADGYDERNGPPEDPDDDTREAD